jgi:hypothetical protein
MRGERVFQGVALAVAALDLLPEVAGGSAAASIARQ